jgi:hypothetical protein
MGLLRLSAFLRKRWPSDGDAALLHHLWNMLRATNILMARSGIALSQPRRLLRSGDLFLDDRSARIQPESPNRGTDDEKAGRNDEWRLPRSKLD